MPKTIKTSISESTNVQPIKSSSKCVRIRVRVPVSVRVRARVHVRVRGCVTHRSKAALKIQTTPNVLAREIPAAQITQQRPSDRLHRWRIIVKWLMNYWQNVGRLLAKCWQIVGKFLANCWRIVVGRVLAVCWQTVGGLLAEY